jgi:hypothetical protein
VLYSGTEPALSERVEWGKAPALRPGKACLLKQEPSCLRQNIGRNWPARGTGEKKPTKKPRDPGQVHPIARSLSRFPVRWVSLLLRFKPRYRVEFQFETPLSDNGRKSDSPTRGYLPKEEGSSARAFFLP